MKFYPGLFFVLSIASGGSLANPSLDEVCLEEAREDYLKVNQRGTKITRYLQGIEVTDFEETFNFANRALNGMYRDPELYADCDSAICIMARFANDEEIALRSASIHARDGYNLKFKNDNPAWGSTDFIWTKNNLRAIQNALDLLPVKFRPSKAAFQYFQSIDGNTNYFHQGARIISLTPKANTGVVLHEMGHATSMANFFSDVFSFRFFRSDNKRTSYAQAYYADRAAGTPGGFNRSKEEDYANSFAYYVEDNAGMKVRSPNRFEFMKEKLFNNEEISNANVDELNKIFTPELKADLFLSCFENTEFIGHLMMASADRHWQAFNSTAPNIRCLTPQIAKIWPKLQSKRLRRLYCFEGGEQGINELMAPHFQPMFIKLLTDPSSRRKLMTVEKRFEHYFEILEDETYSGLSVAQKMELAGMLANKVHI